MSSATSPRLKWARRAYWAVWSVIIVAVLELATRHLLARPGDMIRRSADADMVYELVPGTWVSHVRFGLWSMPIFMIMDIFNVRAHPELPVDTPEYTAYRIDDDGCRLSMKGPEQPRADVIALGSSQTFGLFVPEEQTVVGVLQQLLRDRGLTETVANCGVLGHHFVQTLRTAELLEPRKHPKLNVMMIRPWHLRQQLNYMDILAPQDPTAEWLMSHSDLMRLLYYLHKREATQEERLPFLSREALDAKVTAYVHDMAPHRVRTIAFLLEDHTPEDKALDVIEAVLRSHGIETARIWTPVGGQREYFVDHERHWNAKGATLMAGEMIDTVAGMLKELDAPSGQPDTTALH